MPLKNKKGLVIGIANDQSVAYGCAEAFAGAGANLAVTYLNEKAGPVVRPLAEALKCPIIMPCDVREPGELEAVLAYSRCLGPSRLRASFDRLCTEGRFAQPCRRLFAGWVRAGNGCFVPLLHTGRTARRTAYDEWGMPPHGYFPGIRTGCR